MGTRFKKYPSIINHYSETEVHYWLTINPGLAQAKYILQEKIHGSNVSFYIPPKGEIIACSRKRVLPHDENFFGLPAVRERYFSEFKILQEYAKEMKKVVRPYGELFGGGIQKGVEYGEVKRILFFDMKIDEKWLSPDMFYHVMDSIGLSKMKVPTITIIGGLQEALDYDCNYNSTLFEAEEGTNIMEGVVIKPINLIQESPQGSLFRIKKKNEAFKDKAHSKKPPAKIDESLLLLQQEYEDYLTPMRLQGIFSKEGEIWKASQIGEYIKYVMDDAMKDFQIVHAGKLEELNKKDKKTIFKTSGRIISLMLKEFMEGK